MTKKVVFMGTPGFAVNVLESLIKEAYEVVLVVTQPDRPVGRKRTLTPPPVKEVATAHDIPVFQPEKIRDDYETILSYEPDIIITCAYGQILPTELLDYPAYGSINVHASLLPELRGGAPIHYAILQGKQESGVTIMYMVDKLDAGDMISKVVVPIEETDHTGILHDKLSEAGANLLIETLPSIFARTNDRKPQDGSQATFAPNISRDDEKINWQDENSVIYNQVRGLHPWPVAYTTYQGERMKIWWVTKQEETYPDQKPGTVVQVKEGAFTVVCGQGSAVDVTDLQVAGKKRMTTDEYLRGNQEAIQVGDILE